MAAGAAMLVATLAVPAWAADNAQAGKTLAQQIFDAMVQEQGVQPGHRIAHAKGIVVEGTFVPSPAAARLSRAAHLQGGPVPVTVRFSDGPGNLGVADNAPDAGPRGMGIRFTLPGGGLTDIEGVSHNGFAVGTGEDFLALQKAVVATDPSRPHPWPVEEFLTTHPRALKFVQETAAAPASFATEAYFSNNAYVFVNKDGLKQAVRYQMLPAAGIRRLSEAEAKGRSPDFLRDEIRARLAKGPVEFRLVAQLPNAGDPTNDASLAWPDDRRTVDLGTIRIVSVAADSATAEKALVFFPTAITDGIELSDDPLVQLRTSVYALSFARRQQP